MKKVDSIKQPLVWLQLIIALVLFAGCNESRFDLVTKTVEIQDTIRINEIFTFRLWLANNTEKTVPLTLNRKITSSVKIDPAWHCDDLPLQKQFIKRNDIMPTESYNADLVPGDSYAFLFTGVIREHPGDSLVLHIDGIENDEVISHKNCSILRLSINGAWLLRDKTSLNSASSFTSRPVHIIE